MCPACAGRAYKGRIGIFEAFVMDQALEELLPQKPSAREVEEATRHQNLPTLAGDGVIKVLQGITSAEELDRVAPFGLGQ